MKLTQLEHIKNAKVMNLLSLYIYFSTRNQFLYLLYELLKSLVIGINSSQV
jgi:hypothetical protein